MHISDANYISYKEKNMHGVLVCLLHFLLPSMYFQKKPPMESVVKAEVMYIHNLFNFPCSKISLLQCSFTGTHIISSQYLFKMHVQFM